MESNPKNKIKLVSLVLLLLSVSVIIVYSIASLVMQTVYPLQYTNIVETESKKTGVSEELIYALIKTESGFDKSAVSSVGAKGLTQITPETFQWLQTKTGESFEENALFEPDISIRYGVFFLDMLIDEFGNIETALAAYHAGRGIVNEWLCDPRYSEDGKTLDVIPYEDTAGYVKKVLKIQEKYIKLYDF